MGKSKIQSSSHAIEADQQLRRIIRQELRGGRYRTCIGQSQ